MAINISDSLHAAGTVRFAVPGTPAFAGQSGFDSAVIDGGVGDFTVRMTDGVDTTARAVSATPATAAAAAMVMVEDVDDNSIRIRTFDAAGAPIDNVAVAIVVTRHSL